MMVARPHTYINTLDRSPLRYHALVLVQVTDFKLGQYFLYDRLAKDSSAADLGGVVTDLLVDHHLDRGNITEVRRICKRESKVNGRSNPELWSKVLTHMVARCELVTEQQATEAMRRGSITKCSDPEELEECQEELEHFLTEIDDHQELAP